MASTLLQLTERERSAADRSAAPAPHEGERAARPLRVLLVTVGLGVGGTEEQILELASRLNARRFDVTVCALKSAGAIAEELRARGVRVVTLDGRGGWDLRVLVRLFRVMTGIRPDVVHAFLLRANLAARLVGKLRRVPVLVSSYRNLGDSAPWTSRLLDRLTVGWSQGVTCCSDAVRQAALAATGGRGDRFVTIHNGVDLDRFAVDSPATRAELGLSPELPVIGTVCRLEDRRKGLSVLLRAVQVLASASGGRPCQVLILGEGPDRDGLERLGRELGIADRLRFCGVRRDVPRVLPLLDVFVLPSLSEGFGIALVEAMAAGRPIVASTVGGVPEIVVSGDTGLLVPPGDPAALAAAIGGLLDDPGRARELGLRGRLRARALFSIESMVSRHERLYETLAAVGAPPATGGTR